MKDVAIYGATKHSVTTITENLREFMGIKELPIRVTVIYLFLFLQRLYEYIHPLVVSNTGFD